jgi:hypothetical protein
MRESSGFTSNAIMETIDISDRCGRQFFAINIVEQGNLNRVAAA